MHCHHLLLIAVVWLICLSFVRAADTHTDSEQVLDWAENFYPHLFPSRQASQTEPPWLYRHYPETDTYLGVNIDDGQVYLLTAGQNALPVAIGSLVDLLNVAQSGGDRTANTFFSLELPGFPHSIDFYHPAGAVKALVFLHGAAGQNDAVAHDLSINLSDQPPTSDTIDWAWLDNEKILAVFPQGQAITTFAYTWNNYVMESGQNDIALLQVLAHYLRTQFGIDKVYLAGHSNGGMMVNRMWCESPQTFDSYAAISGPASSHFLSHPCAPSVIRPYLGIVGDQDATIQVKGNWDSLLWSINPLLVIKPSVVEPGLINEWISHQARAQLGCGEFPSDQDKFDNGSVEIWRNCGGFLELQRILTGAHSIKSLEAGMGVGMRDTLMQFFNRRQETD
ncbi:MAG: hypothetical protein LZF61_00615 [Nitrosomonas sp.]|nr:MAG: hypothetical protein LZF61_00615 [Nitrosomonas sp.]